MSKAGSFLCCPLCARKYTVTSLRIHWPQCLVKWQTEQAATTLTLTKQVPKLPQTIQALLQRYPDFAVTPSEASEFNAAAQQIFAAVNLVGCQYCARTFLPDRLPVHLRACASAHGQTAVGFAGASKVTVGLSHGISATKSALNTAQNHAYMTAMNVPKVVMAVAEDRLPVCKLCSRKFGTASFVIHLVSCGRKHGKDQDEIDAMIQKYQNQPAAVAMPGMTVPQIELEIVDQIIEQANTDSYTAFMDQRIQCQSCTRKFTEDRFQKHTQICKGKR